MRISIRLRHLFLFASVLVCTSLLAVQKQDTIFSFVDSLKHVLNEKKMTTDEQFGILLRLGIEYNGLEKFDSARIYLNHALNLPGGKEFCGGRIIVNLANSYAFNGEYSEALKYYLEALGVAEKLEENVNIIRSMANAAEMYYLMGNHDRALYYAERAKDRVRSPVPTFETYMLPQIYYVIGSVYLDRGLLDKAEESMTKSYEIADSVSKFQIASNGDPLGMLMYCSYGKEGLARVCLERKDYAKALELAGEALDFAGQNGDPPVVAKVFYAFSDIYLAQNDYAESGKYALKALDTSPESMELYPGIAFNIATSNLFAGNSGKAFAFFQIYSDQMKKNTGKQFRETMASMDIQFETKKKELDISNLEHQRILYIFVGIAGILLAITVWCILWLRIRNEQKEKQLVAANAVFEGEKRERERFARDLHDGVNGMLSAIRIELAATEHLQNIRDRIDDCIEEIRRLANGVMPVSLQRFGIKAALEDYRHTFPNVQFYFFGENKRFDEKIELVVYYCAYELIHNSVKHSGATNINVQLVQEEDRISLSVQDNGCGYDKESSNKGVGLKSLYDRVMAFNGKIEVISSPENGTETTVELRVESYE